MDDEGRLNDIEAIGWEDIGPSAFDWLIEEIRRLRGVLLEIAQIDDEFGAGYIAREALGISSWEEALKQLPANQR